MKYLSLLSAIFLLLGCSQPTGPMPKRDLALDLNSINSVEVFMSRSNLNSTEFEHFKYSASNLFIECGKINRGRYYPEQQEVIDTSPETDQLIQDLTLKVVNNLTKSKLALDKPGDNNNLFDPGVFTLSLSSSGKLMEAKTSVDAVSDPDSAATRELKNMTTQLRQAAGSNLCGNIEFYGIK